MTTKRANKPSISKHLKDIADQEQTVNGAPERRWATQDLKRIKNQACQIRAENLLKNIRSIANQFIHEHDKQSSPEDDFIRSLRRKLFSLNPAARIVRVQENLVVLKASIPNLIPALPNGYGFKGGAARCIFNHTLGKNQHNSKLRDIDIVRFGEVEFESNRLQDREVAYKFMSEDLAHGNGVEVCQSIDKYLATRDLVINEVVVLEGQLYCSRACLEDTLNNIIRPSEQYRSEVPSATALKAIRLALELQGNTLRMLGIPSTIQAKPFEIALQLSRALSAGNPVAEMFIEECVKRKALIAKESMSVSYLKRHFKSLLGAGSPL